MRMASAASKEPDVADRKTAGLFAASLFAGMAIAAALLVPAAALAQSSLGIGTAEPSMAPAGPFAGFLQWVNAEQQRFYRALTGSLKAMRDDGSQLWLLIGLSFAYGVFHAAGPGHGKAVISSYMLANEVALRRGVMLSFISALLQGVTAIVIMSAVFLMLRGTSVSMTDASRFLEIASYALVTGFGAWLLWRKAGPSLRGILFGNPVRSLSASIAHAHHDHHHHHHDGEVCATCGHAHAPDPKMLSGERFDWRTAWAAIVAVGLRPCTGALIVLSFAFLNGLWVAGIVAVIAMAAGTAITVSLLATLAVFAKNRAVAAAGAGHAGNRVHAAIEIAGAAFVFLLGLTLLTASLSA